MQISGGKSKEQVRVVVHSLIRALHLSLIPLSLFLFTLNHVLPAPFSPSKQTQMPEFRFLLRFQVGGSRGDGWSGWRRALSGYTLAVD